jgi:molybdate transport system permease protein
VNVGLRRSPLPWLGALLAVYLALPLVGLIAHLATTRPLGFRSPGLWPAVETSVVTASISTIVIALAGVPLAYVLARSTGRLARVVGVVVLLPLALPPLISGILLIAVVGPYSFFGRLTGGRLTDSLAGVVIAQTFVAAPFLVVVARSAFGAVEVAYTDVAATLGLGVWSRFWRVAVPVAAPGVTAGLLLSWLRAFGEFGATVVVAYHPSTLPVETYTQFSGSGLTSTLAPATIAVVVAGMVVLVSAGRLSPVRRARPTAPIALTGGTGSTVHDAAFAPHGTGSGARGELLSFSLDHHLGAFHLRIAHDASSPRLALLGPSGAGKSTVLKCLAGLVAPNADVRLGGRPLRDVPAEGRLVGYVPQGPSLLPHRTVWQQLLVSPRATPAVAAHWLERLELTDLRDRLPAELSGGELQRVAVARALSSEPRVLLLDEPLSALDTAVRRDTRHLMREVLGSTGITSVVVTHDPEEAALLADEIVVLVAGRLVQAGGRAEVFGQPRDAAVARLLGVRNVGLGRVLDGHHVDLGGLVVDVTHVAEAVGSRVLWSIVPEAIEVGTRGRPNAVVADVADLGTSAEIALDVAPRLRLVARPTGGAGGLRPDDGCTVRIPPGSVRVWPTEVGDS